MEDKLKKWADQNRESFEELEPSDALWNKIERRLDENNIQKGRRSSFDWVWKVAAALFLGLSVVLLLDKFRSEETGLANQEKPQIELPQEFRKVEQFYSDRLEEGKKELANLSHGDPQLFAEMTSELIKMDSLYEQLRHKLPNSSNPDVVIDAMTANLRLRMELLQRQLQLLQQFQSRRPSSANEDKSETAPI